MGQAFSFHAERALFIGAHPDDIEFGVAGSIAQWTDDGAEVTYCLVTDGGAGSNKPGEDLAALIKQREAEQREAAAIGRDVHGFASTWPSACTVAIALDAPRVKVAVLGRFVVLQLLVSANPRGV